MSFSTVALGDVADVNWGDTNVTKASYVDTGFPAYSAAGADGYLPYADFDRMAIVLSAIGARCGRTWFVQGNWSCIKNTISFWSTDLRLDVRFLYWVTNRGDFFPKRGAAQPFITIGDARDTKIPLPPIDEQRRIAAILDSLTQALFVQVFGELSSWNAVQPLGDLADIVSGITKGRKLNGEHARPVPYMAVANVQDKRLNIATVKTIDASESEINRYRLKENDLLLTEGGDPDKLGRGTLWKGEISEAIYQNHIFRVRLKSNEALPIFLMWLVSSSYGKSYFLRSAKQTTGIASINKQQLSAFPVPLPPLSAQQLFVDGVQAATRLAASKLAASTATSRLFTSLQHRAFSGQL